MPDDTPNALESATPANAQDRWEARLPQMPDTRIADPPATAGTAETGGGYEHYRQQMPRIRAWLDAPTPSVAGVPNWEDEGGHV
jgi:hypothetical protein